MGKGPTVTLVFAGDDSRLNRTIKSVESSTSSLTKRIGSVGKGVGILAAASSGLTVLGGAIGAVTQLSGAALILPGAALSGAAAMFTLKLATSGFGDAMKNMEDPKKFAASLKEMAPEAAATAVAIKSMLPQFKSMKKEVQGKFFSGFATDAKALGGTYLPIMSENMGAIATRMNGMARESAKMLMQPAAVNDVNQVFNSTIALLGTMRGSLANVLSGFLGIAGVGATYLPALGGGIERATKAFKAWVDAGVESGRINQIIDAALAGFRDLGSIVMNVGATLGSVFRGLGGDTTSFLQPLRETTAMIAAFAASPAGQEAFRQLGEVMRAAGTLVRDTLLSALNFLVPIISFLAPIVTSVANSMASWSGVIGPLVVGAFALAGVIQVITGAMAIYNAISGAVRAATAAWAAVQWVLNSALFANPIGIVVIAIAAFVAAIILAYRNSETFRNIVTAAWNGIKSAISAGVNFAKSALAWFASLGGLMRGWWNGAVNAVTGAASSLIARVRAIPGQILGALSNLGSLLIGAGRSLIEGLWAGIQGAIGWVKDKIGGALSAIRNLFPFSPAKEGPFSGRGYTSYSGAALMEDFGKGIQNGGPDLRGIASGALGPAQGALNGSVRGSAGRAARGSGGAIELKVAAGADSALGALLMRMARNGELQLRAA